MGLQTGVSIMRGSTVLHTYLEDILEHMFLHVCSVDPDGPSPELHPIHHQVVVLTSDLNKTGLSLYAYVCTCSHKNISSTTLFNPHINRSI